MTIDNVKLKVDSALDDLYRLDNFLIQERLCEPCITHRFAVHLEKQDFEQEEYFVDCEYNKSHLNKQTNTKVVSNPNGNYIDIVITKRNGNWQNDLACFETKCWNNYNDRKKDRDNLEILTGKEDRFGYKIGFYVLFGRDRTSTKVEIYQNGVKI